MKLHVYAPYSLHKIYTYTHMQSILKKNNEKSLPLFVVFSFPPLGLLQTSQTLQQQICIESLDSLTSQLSLVVWPHPAQLFVP